MLRTPFALPDITQREIDAVSECMRSGWLTSGQKVKDFEAAFAREIGKKHAISCNSATSAALVLLQALDVGPGDEVIVPVWTFSGPAMMAHKLGATVVLCDVSSHDFNVTPENIRKVMTRNTRVVMPTHFAGRSAPMAEITALCTACGGIDVIDDAAHAFPTVDPHSRKVGNQGTTASFFSFYATKTLTTGEGGMITTDEDALAEKLRKLRSHGINRDVHDRYTNAKTGWRYEIEASGWKANMPDTAAAMGLVQLQRATELHLKRAKIASMYHNALKDLVPRGLIALPEPEFGHAWHLYPIRLQDWDRDDFIMNMGLQGVQCSVHFIPLHKHRFWRNHAKNGFDPHDFPNAERLSRQEVSLPIYSKMTYDEVMRVVTAVKVALRCSRG